MPPSSSPSHSPKKRNSYLQYTHLSFQWMAVISLSMWLGRQLDDYWQMSFPVFLSVLTLGSIIGITYLTIMRLSGD